MPFCAVSAANTVSGQFEAATGYGTGAGLCGWNCRHTFFSIFPELGAPPAWTQKSLEKLNAQDIEYSEKKYTRYEISQMQRARERTVRKYKRRYLAETEAGVDNTASAVKLRQSRQELADFISATGGRADSARTSVAGFGRSASSKATWAAKRQERLDAVNNDLTALRQSGKIKLTGTAVTPPALPNTLSFEGHAIEQMENGRSALRRPMNLLNTPFSQSASATVHSTLIILKKVSLSSGKMVLSVR